MKNLIPKLINKSKLTIWRTLGLSGMFVFGVPLTNWQKILAVFLLSIFAIPLIMPIQPGIKGWNAIILWFKHLSMIKKYQKDTSNDTSLLVPYDKVVNEYFIETQKINGKKTLVAAISVKGFDITLLNPEEQELRLKDLQDVLKFANFPMTFLKLETLLAFDKKIKYYQSQLTKLKQRYQVKAINKNEFDVRKTQIESLITLLEKDLIIQDEVIKTKKTFYIFVYGKTESEIWENINLLENKLINGNFICEKLTSYEIVQTLQLIWNPYGTAITKAEFEAKKDDLSVILSFEKF